LKKVIDDAAARDPARPRPIQTVKAESEATPAAAAAKRAKREVKKTVKGSGGGDLKEAHTASENEGLTEETAAMALETLTGGFLKKAR